MFELEYPPLRWPARRRKCFPQSGCTTRGLQWGSVGSNLHFARRLEARGIAETTDCAVRISPGPPSKQASCGMAVVEESREFHANDK